MPPKKKPPVQPSAELVKAKDQVKALKTENAELTLHAMELTGADDDADMVGMRKASTRGRVGSVVARSTGAGAGGVAYEVGPGTRIGGLFFGLIGKVCELAGLGGETAGIGHRAVNTASGGADGITGAAAADAVRKRRAKKAQKNDTEL